MRRLFTLVAIALLLSACAGHQEQSLVFNSEHCGEHATDMYDNAENVDQERSGHQLGPRIRPAAVCQTLIVAFTFIPDPWRALGHRSSVLFVATVRRDRPTQEAEETVEIRPDFQCPTCKSSQQQALFHHTQGRRHAH